MGIAERLKVLIVDDQVTSRLMLADALERMGFKSINVAKDGQDALTLLASQPHHLIISDFNMPRMDGIELLKAVRADATLKKAAFIILTARTDRALLEQAQVHGANNIMSKPFTDEKMKATIEAVFGVLEL